jgi:osmotically-inducible protein OsmY
MNSLLDTSRTVKDHVRRQLLHNPYHALRNVSCEYRDGVLTLRGRLPSYYLKQVAQTAVAHTAGVQRVDNAIEVAPALLEPSPA